MDFGMEVLPMRCRIKILTGTDACTKEAIDLIVNFGIFKSLGHTCPGAEVCFRGYPKAIRTDEGPKYAG